MPDVLKYKVEPQPVTPFFVPNVLINREGTQRREPCKVSKWVELWVKTTRKVL